MTNFDVGGLFCGGIFCGGGNFCGVWVFFYAVLFFPRDTPLTQQAVNCNEWSFIIAPLDPVSLYRKKNQKSFWGLCSPLFFYYWEEVVGTSRRGFILAHYDIVITFCYLITIPKHINDMEDLLSHPIWCLSFVAFASISLLSFLFFILFFISFLILQMQLMKKQRGKQKPT